MSATHWIRLYRQTPGDLGDYGFPVLHGDDASARDQASQTLIARFEGTRVASEKPTQAHLCKLETGGRETPILRLAISPDLVVRELPLETSR